MAENGEREIAIPDISFLNKGKGKLSKKNYSLELNKNSKVSGEGGEGVKQLQQLHTCPLKRLRVTFPSTFSWLFSKQNRT